RLGTIQGTVFNDSDGDGAPDFAELPYSGVTVTIVGLGPDGVPGGGDDLPPVMVDTAADGSYLFTGLPAMNYRITVDEGDLPAGVDTLTTGTNPRTVSLAPSQVITQDFGYEVSVLTLTKSSNAPNP